MFLFINLFYKICNQILYKLLVKWDFIEYFKQAVIPLSWALPLDNLCILDQKILIYMFLGYFSENDVVECAFPSLFFEDMQIKYVLK